VIGNQLGAAEIMTLAQLSERINGLGREWHRSFSGVGPTKARRIEDWLREHGEETRLTIGAHVRVPRSRLYPEELAKLVTPATAVRPLEKFIVPSDLDGSQGAYRQPQRQCLLRARNDYEAIQAWLSAKRPMSPHVQAAKQRRQSGGPTLVAVDDPLFQLEPPALSHTQRAYRKEAERFLLWAILERRKPLSSMSTEDCTAYRDFLADPQPAETWCAPRGRQRWSPLWRPFEGPLSPSGIRHAVTILKNLYGFLTQQNYLMGNPWAGVAMPRDPGRRTVTRSFTTAQWDFIGKQLVSEGAKRKPEEQSEKTMRLSFTLNFLYTTGLRLSEAVNTQVRDLNWVEYPPGPGQDSPTVGWELTVVGKGDKLREVVVPNDVVRHLQEYLVKRGLGTDLNTRQAQSAYILAPLKQRAEQAQRFLGDAEPLDAAVGMAEATLYSMLKTFFVDCATVLTGRDPKGAEQFRKASTHWLRHTYASHGIARGVPLEITQGNLGHASIATTTIYVTTEKEQRMRAMQDSWKSP
ncbi:MAG: tyrosine-type recombinase/integrase, partial [Burkholderiaceae bacterium]